MPTEMFTTNGSALPATASTPAPASDDELRDWARRHVESVHRLQRNIAAYLLGMVALTGVWALVEWQDNGGFERFSDQSNPGDWNPWIVYVALIWGFVVAIEALRVYFDRPATEAEIERVLGRR